MAVQTLEIVGAIGDGITPLTITMNLAAYGAAGVSPYTADSPITLTEDTGNLGVYRFSRTAGNSGTAGLFMGVDANGAFWHFLLAAVTDTYFGDLRRLSTSLLNTTGVMPANVTQWLGTAPLALSSQQVQSVVPSSTVVASVTGLTASNLDATVSSRASQSSLDTLDDYVDTEIAAIKAKTDQLVFTVANQVDANALSGGGSGLDAAQTRAALGLAAANLDTQLTAIDDYLDTEVAAIKAKTDNLPSDPADQSAVEAAITAATAGLATSAALTTVQADTDDIQSRLPAALVSGRMDSSIGAMAANTLTAAALATDAVAEIQSGLATPTNITAGTITTAANVTTVNGLAANVITAASTAADYITEVQSGLATAANLATVAGYIDTEITDIQTRLPAALVSGRMDASVGAMAANTLTASALAADAVSEIQSGLATQASVDDLPTIAELATALGTADDATLAAIAAEAVKTAAIKAKTDNLPSDPADQSAVESAITSATSTLATASSLSTLAAKFTGITLLAQWLGLIAGKHTGNTTARTELNASGAGSGTYDETTDSTQALRDRGDAAWITGGGAGTGARSVTVTVNDGTTVLQNALIRMTQGAESYTATTNVSGVAVFALDDATWTVAVTKAGYSFTPTTIIVNGTETATYSMTAVTVTPATAPSQTTCYGTYYDSDGVVESGVVIDLRLSLFDASAAGLGYDTSIVTQVTNVNGYVEFLGVWRSAEYEARRRGRHDAWVRFTTANAATSALPVLIGDDDN